MFLKPKERKPASGELEPSLGWIVSSITLLTRVSFSRALGKAYMPDMEEAKRVSTDYPLAAAHAFVGQYLPKDLGDGQKLKFRFVYLSGNAAERDQDKPLWMLDKYLKIRVKDHSE